MYEWHGWATIRTRYDCDDSDDNPTSDTVDAVRALVATTQDRSNEVADLRSVNGDYHLWLAGTHNHATSGVVELFRAVAALAPGSYGLLHVLDDEDSTTPNGWVCHVMRRGAVTASPDAHLSPHIGRVEDHCD